MNSQTKKLKQPSKQDFTDFKHMYDAGSSYLTGEFPKGKVNIRTLTGACNHWNENVENLVALDLRRHEYHIDIYVFCIYSLTEKRMAIAGWVFFDELLEKAQAVIEDESIYLTLPIKELYPPEEMHILALKEGE